MEEALHAKYNKGIVITDEYRSHFRDIRFNLEKNKGLFCDVLFGEESCARLVCMTAEEMLTDEKRKEVSFIVLNDFVERTNSRRNV